MKKIIFLFLLNLFLANEKPTIALVLSGGGAKGISEIPILHVIDSLNIPIDYVIGTSMGAIGGSLYSIGYSPDEISELILKTPWELIIFDKKNRKKLNYFQKNDFQKYQARFTLKNLKPQMPLGLSSGHETYLYLNRLTRHNELINDYNNFVIPFRCNATDLLSGNEIIFSSGSISKALRASSSIPSVFSPVDDEKLLLVDGGVLNNLGTDIAKDLGADIIIAVDASPQSKEKSDIKDVFDVLSQSIQLNALKKKMKNLKLATILIEPELKSKNTLDFNSQSLKDTYKKGYKAAYSQIKPLKNIAKNVSHVIDLKYVKLSSIPEDVFSILSIEIISKSLIEIEDLFNDEFPEKISKNEFVNKFLNLRQTNKFNNIHYKFLKYDEGYKLIIHLEKNNPITINNVFIIGNNKISSSFINDIINISNGDLLDYANIDYSISQLYNLDFFESIRYELINHTNTTADLKFIIKESKFKKLKLGSSWSNYYQLIGKIQLDLINKPFDRFRIQEKLVVGNSLKENYLHLLYTGRYVYTQSIIPIIKLINKKNKLYMFDDNNLKQSYIIDEQRQSFGFLIPVKNFGFIEVEKNQQTIKYPYNKNEKFEFNSLNIEIDQLNDILYPTSGFKINYYYEKSRKDLRFIYNKFSIDNFNQISKKSVIRLYGDYIDSHELLSQYKNTNYFKNDRTLSYSEFDLFSSNLLSYGLEINYLYKSSQTLRILFHTLENVKFKHHDSINNNINSNNINSFGIGLRVKSILGPINFLWTKGEKKLFNNNNNENYYFSIGIDY